MNFQEFHEGNAFAKFSKRVVSLFGYLTVDLRQIWIAVDVVLLVVLVVFVVLQVV